MKRDHALRLGVFFSLPLVVVGLWEGVKAVLGASDQDMPHVADVLAHLGGTNNDGTRVWVFLLENMRATALEALLGLAFAVPTGIVLALLIAYVRRIGDGLLPIVVGSQSVPLIALAPPLLVWLGTDWKTKSIIAAYVAFFPIVVFTVRGLTSTSPRLLALMRSYAGGRWQTFWKVRAPMAVPHFFTGLRAAAALAVIGAIVAELPVGSREGIGKVIFNAAQYYTFNPPALFASTLAAFVLGVAFFGSVVLVDVVVSRRMGVKR